MQDLVATFIPLMFKDKNNVRLGYTQLLREPKVLVSDPKYKDMG